MNRLAGSRERMSNYNSLIRWDVITHVCRDVNGDLAL